ncbi:MAG: chromosomal replication initiator protein DnaA, partial [Oscillospiraceae bacterium]|nr:chromosomal replication initiator protein DnaA [Oscillospiraceae bacterium]
MNSFEEVFNAVIEYCREVGQIGDVAIKLWIKTITPVGLEGNTAVIQVDSEFQRGVVMANYEELLEKAFKATLGFDVKVDIRVPEEFQINEPVDFDEYIEKHNELEKSYEYAKYDYTFDTFIVGSSNEFAYAACKAVA